MTHQQTNAPVIAKGYRLQHITDPKNPRRVMTLASYHNSGAGTITFGYAVCSPEQTKDEKGKVSRDVYKKKEGNKLALERLEQALAGNFDTSKFTGSVTLVNPTRHPNDELLGVIALDDPRAVVRRTVTDRLLQNNMASGLKSVRALWQSAVTHIVEGI